MPRALKITLISVPCLIIAFLVLGLLVDEGGTMPQKIERECKRTYADKGQAAIEECQLAMTVRYLGDADRSQADSTYHRIR